jgi:hypothetical protein
MTRENIIHNALSQDRLKYITKNKNNFEEKILYYSYLVLIEHKKFCFQSLKTALCFKNLR